MPGYRAEKKRISLAANCFWLASYEVQVNYVDPTLGPEGTRKIIVASHERSGTHFMMNTLADNFGYVSEPWFDIDDDRVINPYAHENIQAYLSGLEGAPVLNLFKTHYPSEFFDGIADWLLGEFTIIYMMRETEPTLISLRKHIKDLPWNAGPVLRDDQPDKKFFMTSPCGALLRYQMVQHRFMWERHHHHLESWGIKQPWADRVIHIYYDDLNEKFDETVERLGRMIGMVPLHEKPQRPGGSERVITAERIRKNIQQKEERHAA